MPRKKKFPVHNIDTFQKLGELATMENIDMLMGNFYGAMRTYVLMKQNHPELKFVALTWIDDGKIEIKEMQITQSRRFKIVVDNQGEKPERSVATESESGNKKPETK